MFLGSHKGTSVGGWHLGDWAELSPRGMTGPAASQLQPPPGVCRCSLIRLTSHRGVAALPAPLAPGLPTGTRPGGVGEQGHVGRGRALTTGPFAVQSDTLRQLSPSKERQRLSQRGGSCCTGSLSPEGGTGVKEAL